MTQPPQPGDPASEPDSLEDAAREFETHRGALLGAAYRVLGSMSTAEDVVQEAWLRWSAADRSAVREPRGYLVRTVTRLALNELRTRQRRREEYLGPWLPEPVSDLPATDASAEVAESVSLAMLVVLESLSPLERAAFILREVFGEDFDDIATTLDRTPAAVRQLVHRAREHVAARSPRNTVDPTTHRKVAERVLAAMQGGSVEELLALLSPDVVLTTDGGGKKKAALRPIRTPEKVLRFLLGVLGKQTGPMEFRMLEVNGEPAVGAFTSSGLDTLATMRMDGDAITEIYLVRNPDKLTRVRLPDAR
ncbi:RNA polymerase sigma-70 factor [Lysobacter korlensis]|uniref:RNA polymerase sigma-70 factor n=1 Tax=Lysobacter korlensis TaxID=553636 RepID=A0ABV6RNB5_9GAMM